MTILAVSNLRKSFGGVRAVAGISFDLAAGEMLALIGPNGAGKSTCFDMVTGQLAPDGGRILLDGTDLAGKRPRDIARLGVGRSFQVAATFGSMSLRENLQTALLSTHRHVWNFWSPTQGFFIAEAQALLAQVGLADQAGRAASLLAYADLKRLELALALASTPRLLLMDEPTAGMAPSERAALMSLVRTLATAHGMAVLFTEHDMDVVFGIADRILVLDRGAIIAQGSGAEIRADPRVRDIYLGTSC